MDVIRVNVKTRAGGEVYTGLHDLRVRART